MNIIKHRVGLLWLMLFASLATATESHYSPWVEPGYPTRLLWGDTHIHTRLSADAFSMGDSLTPEQAYRFAKGEAVRGVSGQTARLSRPLDFVMISDHAEYLGVSALLNTAPERLEQSALGQRWLELYSSGQLRQILFDNRDASMGRFAMAHDQRLNQQIWEQVARIADHHNQPGVFTAFIGYEWTSLPDGNNLHRNVMYRDDAKRALIKPPFTAMDSRDPADLWAYLYDYERRSGGQALAIPHNPNISNGQMFADLQFNGNAIDADYAAARRRWEPVVEVTQIKGDSETHPLLSPDDPYADFETWDAGNFAPVPEPKQPGMLPHEYARSALKRGLLHQKRTGENPYAFGLIGSSDTHTGISAIEEDGFFGKFSLDAPSAARAHQRDEALARYSAAGFVGVWSEDNTRAAIFDAFKRREVYATTGPRIRLRVYAGWHYDDLDVQRPDFAAVGAAGGVPMGGELRGTKGADAPVLMISAARDPIGARLERLQVVKGWVDQQGSTHERVYDVAISNNASGASPAAVDGAAELAVVWRDPHFDPQAAAFYYIRVLEVPTPRWTTRDAQRFGTALPDSQPEFIQERAYSSPIWYRPG